MLSNKWTFSLTSLVVLIAFGLVCGAIRHRQTMVMTHTVTDFARYRG